MSSDAPERPRKTLSLTPRPGARTRNPNEEAPRKRSGARAQAVARAERAAQQAPEAPQAPARKPVNRTQDGAPATDRGRSERSPRDASKTELRYQRGVPSRSARPDGDAPSRRARRPEGARTEQARPGQAGPERADGATQAYDRSGSGANRADAQAANIAARHAQTNQAERFKVFAPCPQGLEEALSAELLALGFEDARPGRAGASFSADWVGIQRANLYTRLATRVLVQVAQAPMHADDDVLELARATPWERWFGPEHTLRVDTSAIRSPVQSLQYCNLRAKDGICDRLREYEGARPSIDTVRPDARVHLFLFEQTATLYLDTSGESLFKRGWRLDKGEAPLRENLAAGMLALADWDPEQALMDPFCGSGTLLIEAAWIALGIPPGIARPLGFERLRGHDAHVWDLIKEEAYSRIAPGLDAPIIGYDIDPAAIEFCKRNAERAWLADDAIRFEVRDARQAERVAETGWIVTNPPYGDRLENSDPELWQGWSSALKHNFAGWNLHVITSDLAFPQRLRLKPRRRTPLFNGGIECRLFGFELVEASFRKT